MEKLNVAIADDNEKMLDLLGNLINEDKELELVCELFLDVYTRFLPQMTPGFSVLEISYSIGIGLGVVLYFNHFGRRKFTQDPTPLEVEMRVYEDDIDTTIIEQNDRSGKGKEAFHANPARDPADHSRS